MGVEGVIRARCILFLNLYDPLMTDTICFHWILLMCIIDHPISHKFTITCFGVTPRRASFDVQHEDTECHCFHCANCVHVCLDYFRSVIAKTLPEGNCSISLLNSSRLLSMPLGPYLFLLVMFQPLGSFQRQRLHQESRNHPWPSTFTMQGHRTHSHHPSPEFVRYGHDNAREACFRRKFRQNEGPKDI